MVESEGGVMSETTIFDKIVAKEINADLVYEDEHVLAFNDINPQAPVHVLVIPKKKVANFSEFANKGNDETGALFKGVAKVANKLGLSENGYRVVVNCGKDGQQTVNYIHAHILGGRQLNWPPG